MGETNLKIVLELYRDWERRKGMAVFLLQKRGRSGFCRWAPLSASSAELRWWRRMFVQPNNTGATVRRAEKAMFAHVANQLCLGTRGLVSPQKQIIYWHGPGCPES